MYIYIYVCIWTQPFAEQKLFCTGPKLALRKPEAHLMNIHTNRSTHVNTNIMNRSVYLHTYACNYKSNCHCLTSWPRCLHGFGHQLCVQCLVARWLRPKLLRYARQRLKPFTSCLQALVRCFACPLRSLSQPTQASLSVGSALPIFDTLPITILRH